MYKLPNSYFVTFVIVVNMGFIYYYFSFFNIVYSVWGLVQGLGGLIVGAVWEAIWRCLVVWMVKKYGSVSTLCLRYRMDSHGAKINRATLQRALYNTFEN